MQPDANDPARFLSEDDLHALVDGHLAPARREAVLQALAHDPQAHATWRAWQQQRAALRGLHPGLLDAEVPPAMEGIARRAQRLHWQAEAAWRWGGVAAGVLCAFALGWFTRVALEPAADGALALVDRSGGRASVREFVRQASVAHMVYAPEQRHPVEVTAAEQAHLVQWLSRRLQRPLKVPDLREQGYALVGGRLLPGADGARAQFMFQDAAGGRITLYLGAMQPGAASAAGPLAPTVSGAASADLRESAFRFSDTGPVPGFYWVEQGFGYALSGQLTRAQLMALAQAVYRQL